MEEHRERASRFRPDGGVPPPDAGAAPTLHMKLLGGFEVRGTDGPIRLESAKTGALLAYLALEEGPHTRQKLMTLLWGDLPEDRAAGNLRRALWDIRRKLESRGGRPWIRSDRRVVAFEGGESCGVDALEFARLGTMALQVSVQVTHWADLQRLARAAALYRGDLMEGLHLEGAEAFEE